MVIGMDGVIRERARERERARMSEDGRKTMSYKIVFYKIFAVTLCLTRCVWTERYMLRVLAAENMNMQKNLFMHIMVLP